MSFLAKEKLNTCSKWCSHEMTQRIPLQKRMVRFDQFSSRDRAVASSMSAIFLYSSGKYFSAMGANAFCQVDFFSSKLILIALMAAILCFVMFFTRDESFIWFCLAETILVGSILKFHGAPHVRVNSWVLLSGTCVLYMCFAACHLRDCEEILFSSRRRDIIQKHRYNIELCDIISIFFGRYHAQYLPNKWRYNITYLYIISTFFGCYYAWYLPKKYPYNIRYFDIISIFFGRYHAWYLVKNIDIISKISILYPKNI